MEVEFIDPESSAFDRRDHYHRLDRVNENIRISRAFERCKSRKDQRSDCKRGKVNT